jgi:endonuclease III
MPAYNSDRSEHKRAKEIISLLKTQYKDCWTSLNYSSPFQLLISVMLSAQATDAQINKLTPKLFAKYPDAKSMCMAPLSKLEKLVHGSGFYKNKAKNLKKTAQMLVELHDGEVPNSMEELTSLAGVGRKTANIVLFHAFGITKGIAVDTHCMRVSYRIGFTTTKNNQEKIEKELMLLVPKDVWGMYTNWMVHHGRGYCTAKKPDCVHCPLKKECKKRDVQLK